MLTKQVRGLLGNRYRNLPSVADAISRISTGRMGFQPSLLNSNPTVVLRSRFTLVIFEFALECHCYTVTTTVLRTDFSLTRICSNGFMTTRPRLVSYDLPTRTLVRLDLSSRLS